MKGGREVLHDGALPLRRRLRLRRRLLERARERAAAGSRDGLRELDVHRVGALRRDRGVPGSKSRNVLDDKYPKKEIFLGRLQK